MAANPQNLIQGPAILYTAPFGTAEPADSTVTPNGFSVIPAAPWADAGGTEEGVAWDVEHTYSEQTVDQLPDVLGGRLIKRVVQVTTTLAEATLANLNLATNGLLTISVNNGYTTADPVTTTSSTQPSYTAMMIYGWGPLLPNGGAALRRITLRKCLSQVKAQVTYKMDKGAVFAVTFQAYWVSASVPLYHIVEATA